MLRIWVSLGEMVTLRTTVNQAPQLRHRRTAAIGAYPGCQILGMNFFIMIYCWRDLEGSRDECSNYLVVNRRIADYSSAVSLGLTSASISFIFLSCLRRASLSGPYVEGICHGREKKTKLKFSSRIQTRDSGLETRTSAGTYLWIAANMAACPTAVTCKDIWELSEISHIYSNLHPVIADIYGFFTVFYLTETA